MTAAPAQRPPFRADHVGSLLRPKAMREAFRRHAAGEMSAQALAEVQNAAILDVVRLQEEVGLKVVTDGEFRRSSYWGRFVERCSGFVIKPAEFKFRDDQGHEVDFTATYATARLARNQPLAALVLAGEDEHRVACSDVLAAIHRLLADEIEGFRARIA